MDKGKLRKSKILGRTGIQLVTKCHGGRSSHATSSGHSAQTTPLQILCPGNSIWEAWSSHVFAVPRAMTSKPWDQVEKGLPRTRGVLTEQGKERTDQSSWNKRSPLLQPLVCLTCAHLHMQIHEHVYTHTCTHAHTPVQTAIYCWALQSGCQSLNSGLTNAWHWQRHLNFLWLLPHSQNRDNILIKAQEEDSISNAHDLFTQCLVPSEWPVSVHCRGFLPSLKKISPSNVVLPPHPSSTGNSPESIWLLHPTFISPTSIFSAYWLISQHTHHKHTLLHHGRREEEKERTFQDYMIDR